MQKYIKERQLEVCKMEKINLTMLTDFYELTMANGYLENGIRR